MYQLSHVTHAIIELLRAEFVRRFGANPPVNLVPTLPEPNPSGSSIHVYLYHVKECPHNRNLPSPGGAGPVPIQHTPLVLVLQYLITAVHGSGDGSVEGNESYFVEQDYLGYVARAIHDYPLLTKDTEFPLAIELPNAQPLSDYIDEGAELELILRPAPPEETISFYSAGQQVGVRPSLFVEARVALIEPEPPKTTLPGFVLSLGTLVAPMNKVGLVGSHSSLSFLQQGNVVTLNANPGRVAVFANALPLGNPAVANNRLTLETYGTIGGDTELVLEGNGQRVRTQVRTQSTFRFVQSVNTLSMDVLSLLDQAYVNDALTPTDALIVPGLYSARLLVRYPDLRTRATNTVAFFVMPHVLGVANALVSGNVRYTLSISGQYLTSPLVNDIELSVGAVGMRRLGPPVANGVAPFEDGTFTVTASEISFDLPNTNPPTGLQPVQLSVNGVPALPIYVEF
jgi:hypothetical protein